MANLVVKGRSDPERALARRADARLPKYLPAEDARRIVAAPRNDRDRMLLATLWNTGARVTEVLTLRRRDFDPLGRCLRMLNEKRRTVGEKVVYVNDEFALALLAYCDARHLGPGDLLFPSRTGRRLDRVRAYRIVRRAGASVGLPGVHPHTFRHSAAIHLLRSGVPLPVVRDQLGHASILTTLIYTRVSDRDKRQMIGEVSY